MKIKLWEKTVVGKNEAEGRNVVQGINTETARKMKNFKGNDVKMVSNLL